MDVRCIAADGIADTKTNKSNYSETKIALSVFTPKGTTYVMLAGVRNNPNHRLASLKPRFCKFQFV